MRIISAMAAMLFVATASIACDAVDPCLSTAGLTCPSMQLSVCPLGDFEAIGKGCGGSNAYIWVEMWVQCSPSMPLPGIPPTDFWLLACDPAQDLSLCTGGIVADSATNANGRTTFSGRIKGGGCVASGGVKVVCQGVVIQRPYCAGPRCLSIVWKSFDLTGSGGAPDGVVNLSDLIPFGFSYNKNQGLAGYNTCCDYNDDNQCNLSDFAFFGTHYQHRCM